HAARANPHSTAGPAPHTPNIETRAVDSRIATPDAESAHALTRLADSQTVAAADSATEGDEVPSPASIRKSKGATSARPADFMGGDEVPSVAAVNPATPETSTPTAPTQQPAAAPSGGDEVPTATAAPDTSPSQPAATEEEGGEATPHAVATPAAPAAPPAPVDPIVEQLRELASGKFDRLVGDKEKRAALDAFYSKRDYAPVWITEGKVNDRALAAIDYLGRV